MQGKPLSEQEIGKQLLMETVAYAESNRCRRKILLNYFGEDYPEENCGNCDNCLHPKKMFDGQEDMALVLELVASMKENFKTEHLANILAGEINSIIKSYNHHESEFFGMGRDKGVKFWIAIIRQGVILHYLYKDIEQYGLISITDLGREFMEHPHELMLTERTGTRKTRRRQPQPRQYVTGAEWAIPPSMPCSRTCAGTCPAS